MQYIILEAKSAAQLAMLVDQWLDAGGWAPQGGVCLAIDQGNYVYCQALVKNS